MTDKEITFRQALSNVNLGDIWDAKFYVGAGIVIGVILVGIAYGMESALEFPPALPGLGYILGFSVRPAPRGGHRPDRSSESPPEMGSSRLYSPLHHPYGCHDLVVTVDCWLDGFAGHFGRINVSGLNFETLARQDEPNKGKGI